MLCINVLISVCEIVLVYEYHNIHVTYDEMRVSGILNNYFSHFWTKTYVEGTEKNHLKETVLLSTQNMC